MGRLADDYYVIAHDERTGRLRVSGAAAGVGAAAAIIGELVLGGYLAAREGELLARDRDDPPADRLLREVLAQVDAPRQDRDLGAWLRFLAVEAVADLRHRLISDGLVATVRLRRWVLVQRIQHLPTNPNLAAWPAIRLANALSRGEELSPPDQLLATLVQATGLLGDVLWLRPDHNPGWDRAAQVRAHLPADLAQLAAHAEAAVGDGVLARRGI